MKAIRRNLIRTACADRVARLVAEDTRLAICVIDLMHYMDPNYKLSHEFREMLRMRLKEFGIQYCIELRHVFKMKTIEFTLLSKRGIEIKNPFADISVIFSNPTP